MNPKSGAKGLMSIRMILAVFAIQYKPHASGHMRLPRYSLHCLTRHMGVARHVRVIDHSRVGGRGHLQKARAGGQVPHEVLVRRQREIVRSPWELEPVMKKRIPRLDLAADQSRVRKQAQKPQSRGIAQGRLRPQLFAKSTTPEQAPRYVGSAR